MAVKEKDGGKFRVQKKLRDPFFCLFTIAIINGNHNKLTISIMKEVHVSSETIINFSIIYYTMSKVREHNLQQLNIFFSETGEIRFSK